MKLLLILSICSSAFQSLSFVTKSVNCWSIASNSFHERATALHSSVDQASANFDPFSQSLGELSSAAGDVTKELSLSDEVADAGVGDLLGAKLFSDDTVAEALSPLLETNQIVVAGVIFLGFSIMAVLITQLFGPKTKTADMKVSGDQETVSIGVDVDSVGVGHARSTGLEAEKTVVEADVSVPYDAAARYAFMESKRKKMDSSGFFFADIDVDEAEFTAFETEYNSKSIALVVEKKKARDEEKARAPLAL